MTDENSAPIGVVSDIPTAVGLECLKALEELKVSEDVISRLRAVFLTTKTPTRKLLSEALFGGEPLP